MMFPKLVTLTLLFIGLAAGMLVLRQDRLRMANETVTLHHQVVDLREKIWNAQSHAAGELRPTTLQHRLTDAQVAVEPTPPPTLGPATRYAGADSDLNPNNP